MRSRLIHLIACAAALIALAAVVPAAASAAPAAESATPRATTLEKVSSMVQPGIVYLKTTYEGYVRDERGLWLNEGYPLKVPATCSGFFVNPDGHFVTAGHCVDKAEGRAMLIEQALVDAYDGFEPPAELLQFALETWKVNSAETPARRGPDREVRAAYGVDIGGLPTGKALPARVEGLRAFDKGDVALLKLEVENVPVLELAPPSDSGVIGTKVVSVGYPGRVDLVTDQTFDPSFKDGSISSEKTTGEGLVKALEVSAALSPGMSGGPTVDLKGRVVGVNSFGIVGEPQPFNFIRPTEEIAGLLADEGVENELGRTNSVYRQGLAAYYAGDREEAIAKFDEVLGQVQEHEFAQEFRAKALRLPKVKDETGLPTALIAGLIALTLAGAAGAALLMRRRGRPDGSQVTPPQGPRPPRPADRPAPARTPAMVITDGPLAGKRFEIASELVIGRGMVDIALDDEEVSRRHAAVRPLDGAIVLTDLESANGTAVDGRRIARPTLLAHGDVVTVGRVQLRAELEAPDPRNQATAMRPRPDHETAMRAVA